MTFRIIDLIGKANLILDKGFHIAPNWVLLRGSKELGETLDRIQIDMPADIKEAERILNRRDAILLEAQNRAERIINDAQTEADRILSESELLKAVQQEASKIREQVIASCEEIKEQAMHEAEMIKVQAMHEAVKIKEGATNYTEQILNNLETDLNQLQQVVRNGQIYLEQQRVENLQTGHNQYSQQEQYIEQ